MLALVPAGFLVLILLGGLAVDSGAAYLGQRQLHDALVAAANDSVGASVDAGDFYHQGTIVLDPGRVTETACESVLAQHLSGVRGLRMWVSTEGTSVRVWATAQVDAVFGRSIPGFAERKISASAVATLAASAAATPGVPISADTPGTAVACSS